MFWGLIMEPNKRYTQVVEKPFHISQAAMDISTGDNEANQVMVVVDSKNFLVCTLQKNKCIQVPLDLYFKNGDSVSFMTNGKCNVHLTGYLDPEFEDDLEEEEEDEEDEEEAPELVAPKNKRKLENGKESNTAKKQKQDKKSPVKSGSDDEEDSDDDDDDDEDDSVDDALKLLGDELDSDENDDSFKINESADGDDSEEDSDEEDEDEEAAAESTLDSSKEIETDTSKLTKSQKRRLKKKQQKEKQNGVQVNGVEKPKKQEPQQKAEKKKPEKEDAGDKKEKKSLSGGVAIEDLKVGSGPIAKPGKIVQVYYEGRLKSNNKMFDSCQKGNGFKFRLGSKEVISGWDIGVSGMKVGGKRKIVCPPAMAYGAKGSPPVIPPNSTLVFEVELKNVK